MRRTGGNDARTGDPADEEDVEDEHEPEVRARDEPEEWGDPAAGDEDGPAPVDEGDPT